MQKAKDVLDDAAALDRVATLLDGREWDSGDLDEVAGIVRATGRAIRNTEEVCEECGGDADGLHTADTTNLCEKCYDAADVK